MFHYNNYHYAQCHYLDFCCEKCQYVECRYAYYDSCPFAMSLGFLCSIMPSDNMLDVIELSVIIVENVRVIRAEVMSTRKTVGK